MWEDVLRVRQPESFHHEEFVIAIKRKDAVLAYNHCKAQVDAVKLKRKCMRLLSRLIAKL